MVMVNNYDHNDEDSNSNNRLYVEKIKKNCTMYTSAIELQFIYCQQVYNRLFCLSSRKHTYIILTPTNPTFI